MTGIEAVGAYAPQLRVSAEAFEDAWGWFDAPGIEEKAVPDADEDALTMAYEAARRALDAADCDGGALSFLAFASTTPPLAEEDLTPRLGELLGAPATATRHTFTGSTRAGTRALSVGLQHVSGDDVGLVVAADSPRGDPDSSEEHAAGAGAAAFLLSENAAVDVVASAEYATDYPGTRFRQTGDDTVDSLDVTSYERAAFTETLANAVDELDVDTASVDAAAVQSPNGKLPYRAAGALGVDTESIQAGTLVHELGETGAASVPLGLAKAFNDGAERVLAASFGSGAGADAFLFDAREPPATTLSVDGDVSLNYGEYLRRRGDVTSGQPNGGGAYVSVPSWRRTLPQRYRLVAGECPECDRLNFPPEGACSGCNDLVEFESIELAGTGTVEAATVIGHGGAPPEFAPQQAKSGAFAVALVAFDGPGDRTVSAPTQVVDVDPESVTVGDRVDATIRRIYTQEGVTRYGFKVRPA